MLVVLESESRAPCTPCMPPTSKLHPHPPFFFCNPVSPKGFSKQNLKIETLGAMEMA